MKIRCSLWSFVLFFLLLTPTGHAVDVTDRSFALIDGASLEDAVPDEAQELLDGVGVNQDLDFATGVKTLFQRAVESAGGYVKQSLAGGIQIFAVAALCVMTSGLTEKLQKAVGMAGTLAVTLLAVGDMESLLGLGRTTVMEIAAFGKVVMPVLAASAAASGAAVSSSAVYLVVMFVIDVILSLLADVMTPLIWAYIALLTASGVTGNEGLGKLAKALKSGVSLALKLVLGAFVGYLMASGVISGTADAMTVKSVKLAVSSAIPVAGSVIADAAEAVVAGAGIVRGVVGVFGILAILATAILPFLRLAIQYLVFRGSALLAAVTGAEGLDKILEGLGDAFALILAFAGTGAALLLIGIFVSAAGVAI